MNDKDKIISDLQEENSELKNTIEQLIFFEK